MNATSWKELWRNKERSNGNEWSKKCSEKRRRKLDELKTVAKFSPLFLFVSFFILS